MISIVKDPLTTQDISNQLRLKAMASINDWFNRHMSWAYDHPNYLGNITLTAIYSTVIALPDVGKYVYEYTDGVSYQTRLWSVHTEISIHLRQFVFTD